MGVPVLLRATIASIVLVGCVAPVAAKDASTLLDVWVNGRAIGKIGEFDIRGDALAASTLELAELGLAPRVVPVDGLAELVRESGFSWKIDSRSAAIYFTAADNRLVSRSFPASKTAGPALLVESGTGATISYDITGLDTPFGRGASGLVEARLFSRLGLLSTDALVTSGRLGPGVAKGVVRLNSTYGLAFPNAMLRLRLGDFITSGVTSARAVRLGGIQFGSDFGLRPDLITMPLPTLRASAAVPTTADILVNGAYSSSVDVGSGPFDVQNVPVVTGAGTVSLNLRDAGGNAVSRTFAFYASVTELARPRGNMLARHRKGSGCGGQLRPRTRGDDQLSVIGLGERTHRRDAIEFPMSMRMPGMARHGGGGTRPTKPHDPQWRHVDVDEHGAGGNTRLTQ